MRGMNQPLPLSSRGAASETPAYLRHPTLHGDRIAFVADDDLWIVPAAGGIARRLTDVHGHVLHEVLV